MLSFASTISTRKNNYTTLRAAFRSESGAIDLASIMVGIIVIGLIGGVIAATVFAVIPWTQDNAAKQQLESIHTAENASYGLSADPSVTTDESKRNKFTDSAGLDTASLLSQSPTYCVIQTADGQDYNAYAKSASGKIWTASNSSKKAVPLATGVIPVTGCESLGAGVGTTPTTPTNPETPVYVDPTPTITSFTLNCPATNSAYILPVTGFTGKVTWSDGLVTNHTNAVSITARALTSNTEYKVSLDGTYTSMAAGQTVGHKACLRSMDHWGESTGVTDASRVFYDASNLTSVPAHIPSTVTNLMAAFYDASIINDPNISLWNVSNVTNMKQMFARTTFNQPLNDWNVGSVTDMSQMFTGITSANLNPYNQPLDKWDTSKVANFTGMFQNSIFNQPIGTWNVSSGREFASMFSGNRLFNQSLNNWDVSSATGMYQMFYAASSFNTDISSWKPTNVTNMNFMLYGAKYTTSLSGWIVPKAANLASFNNASYPTAFLPTKSTF